MKGGSVNNGARALGPFGAEVGKNFRHRDGQIQRGRCQTCTNNVNDVVTTAVLVQALSVTKRRRQETAKHLQKRHLKNHTAV